MDGHSVSSYKFYSFGIVSQTKERGSFDILVVPIEEINLATGQSEETTVSGSSGKPSVNFTQSKTSGTLGNQKMVYNVESTDHKNILRSQKVQGGLDVTARWTALGQSNRMSPPDVVRGETVMILRVADSDEFFWTTIGNEPSLRRLETVTYMYSNLPSGIKAFDKTTSYWFEVSTHDQYVQLHTSKNNGEAVAWDIKIDTAKGVLNITDNVGNDLTIDAVAGTLDGNFLTSINLKAPTTNIDSNVNINGALSVSGGASIGGGASVGGGLGVGSGGSGDIQIAGNINLTGNIHGSGSLSMDGTVTGSNT